MVRSFDGHPVDDAVRDRILDAGRRAPSAGFSQGTEFFVLNGPAETSRYWALTLGEEADDDAWAARIRHAPLLVLVLSNRDAYLERYSAPDKGAIPPEEQNWWVPYWDVDAGMAAMLMLLAAVDEGLGALFFGIDGPWEPIRDALDIPPAYRCVGLIALGHPSVDDAPSGSAATRARRPLSEIVHRGSW